MSIPHGEILIDLQVEEPEEVNSDLPVVTLSQRGQADFEMLATGALSPLSGFMGADDYHSVLKEMRLRNGLIWSLPIVLPVEAALAEHLKSFAEAVLEGSNGEILGKITIEDIYKADKEKEA